MSKNGFCPICRGSVRREGVRKGKDRYSIIPMHTLRAIICPGTYLPWSHAHKLRQKVKIEIEEISSDL